MNEVTVKLNFKNGIEPEKADEILAKLKEVFPDAEPKVEIEAELM